MSEFTSYAVLGAGQVGNAFIASLLAAKPTVSILILTRSESKSSSLPAEIASSKQIKTAVVDNTSASSMAAALKEHAVEVLVDTVPIYTSDFHNVVVDAAKEAGTVKLFVPSEFGFVTEGGDVSPSQRVAVQKHLRDVGIPFVVIQTGVFTEWIPIIALAQTGKFYIVGAGETPFSTTSVTDIAGFLAHILTSNPLSKLANTFYRLQGSRTTMKAAAALFKLPAEHVDAIPSPPGQDMSLLTGLQMLLESGKGSIGWEFEKNADNESLAGSGNKFWEGHVWRTVEDVHGL